MQRVSKLFEKRINEQQVAEILRLIAETPGRRSRPITGDLPGDHDYWFDGGAYTIKTGTIEYDFQGGHKALVAAPVPWLSIWIEFADGRTVQVQESRSQIDGWRAILRTLCLPMASMSSLTQRMVFSALKSLWTKMGK